MSRAALIILLAFLLTGCAALQSPEQQAVQNASPVVVAQANAITLEAVSKMIGDMEERIYARIAQTSQPDYSWIWALIFVGAIVTCIIVTIVVAVMLARANSRVGDAQSPRIVNNFFMLPFGVSPRGRVFPLNNGDRQLESGQDVTALLEQAINQMTVRK